MAAGVSVGDEGQGREGENLDSSYKEQRRQARKGSRLLRNWLCIGRAIGVRTLPGMPLPGAGTLLEAEREQCLISAGACSNSRRKWLGFGLMGTSANV